MAVTEEAAAPLRIEVPSSPCLSAVDHLGWAGTTAVAAGPYVLGVRSDTDGTGALLREALGDRVVVAEDVPPNLSVVLAGEAAPGEVQELNRLYLGHHLVLRSRDPARVVDGLASHLDAHARTFRHDSLLVLCAALVHDGRAHLVEHGSRRQIVEQERRWQADGFLLVDRPWVDVDLATRELVVPDAGRLSTAVTSWAGTRRPDAPDPAVAAGRYPIATWSPRRGTGTPGHRLAAAASSVVNLAELGPASTLSALRDLLGDVPEVEILADAGRSRPLLAAA